MNKLLSLSSPNHAFDLLSARIFGYLQHFSAFIQRILLVNRRNISRGSNIWPFTQLAF